MTDFKQWEGFEGRIWKEEVNTRDFIQKNYTPYDGDESFLAGPTDATNKLWGALQKLQKAERAKGGVLDMETEVVSGLTAYGPGYIDENLKDLEQIVGLQTDKPLKRAFMPYGGIRMAQEAASTYGFHVNDKYTKIFNEYHKTHNQGVFDAYTDEMRVARRNHIITGLPDTYGRGRIVGDYRRVALYGIDALVAEKKKDLANCGCGIMTDDVIRQREELSDQIKALKDMIAMAASYGFDITRPAENAKEAVQWLYFGYLAGIKEQNGAAMSLGRTSTFLDIYFERDILAHNVNILNIHALEYTGYVAHVCDMKSYFDENLKLIDEKNLNALFPKKNPVYTKIRDDNPTRYVTGSSVSNSLLADGCVIEGTVENCVLFRGVKVKKGAVVKNCVLMQDTVVEPGAELDCVVTDKNVRITAEKKLSGTKSFPVYVQKNHIV